MTMILDAINRIAEMGLRNRQAAIDTNGRTWLYNDSKQCYEEIQLRHVRRHVVSNVESFVALAKEELRRAEKPDGDGATITLTKTGGDFVLHDTGDGLVRHSYKRTLDPFWALLEGMIGRPMKHVDFLRFLGSIAPAIKDYDTLIRQFRKVVFDERLAVTSQPLLDTEGKSGNSFTVEFAARGGTTTTALPAGFDVTVPYTRGSNAHYDLHAEVDLLLKKDGEKNILLFSYYCPELGAVEVTAQAYEEEVCREELAGRSNLLIITNY